MGEKWEGEKESSSFPSSSGSAIPVFGSLISLSGLFHSSFLRQDNGADELREISQEDWT